MKLIGYYAIAVGVTTTIAAALFAILSLTQPDLLRALAGFAASGFGVLVYTAGTHLIDLNHRREAIRRIRTPPVVTPPLSDN